MTITSKIQFLFFLCLTNLQSHFTKVLLLLEHNNPLLFKKIDDYVHLVLFQKVSWIEMIKKAQPYYILITEVRHKIMNDSIFQHKNGTGKEISAWSIFSLILKKFHWLLLSGAAIALALFLPFLFLLHRHINQPQLSMYITVQTGYQPREKSIITTFRLPRALLLHIQKYSRVMRFSIRFCRI